MIACPHCGREIQSAELGGLTARQSEMLKWLQSWDWSHHKSPSYDEICKGLGIKSKSGVSRLLHGLAERGFITIRANKSRGITLVNERIR